MYTWHHLTIYSKDEPKKIYWFHGFILKIHELPWLQQGVARGAWRCSVHCGAASDVAPAVGATPADSGWYSEGVNTCLVWRLAVSLTTLRYNKFIIVHHDHIYVWSVAFILVIGKIWLWGLETCALNQINLGIVLENWIESSFWQFINLFDR